VIALKSNPKNCLSELLDYKPNSEPLKSNWKTLKAELALAKSEALLSQAETVGNSNLVAEMGDVESRISEDSSRTITAKTG
jgi:hypothetical protein